MDELQKDEQPVAEESGEQTRPEEAHPNTGKPVGPATVLQDEPMIEQFPAHEEDFTSK